MQLNTPELLRRQAFVGGRWIRADSGATITVANPATGRELGTVPDMGRAEAEVAIEAAHSAFGPWRAATARTRAGVLRRWHDLMIQHQDDLATIMTAEQGKPLAEARSEVLYAASFLECSAKRPSASTATPSRVTRPISAS
jgi:succinate-semialdehyde dehydrogenase/glutarate-semialdehyde dehydrogenase